MNQIAALIGKELKVLLRDRQALALLFAMPAFFILVMSFALEGVFEAGSKARPIEVLVIDQDGAPFSKQIVGDLKRLEGLTLIETLGGAPIRLEKAEEWISRGEYPLALLIQKGFSERVFQPTQNPRESRATVYFIHDPAMNARLLASVKGAIQGVFLRRALMATLPQRIKQSWGTEAEKSNSIPLFFQESLERQMEKFMSEAGKEGQNSPEVVFISRSPKGFQTDRFPTATEQNVPAYTIFGVFFIVLTLASSFVQEKKEGTFQRILAAPLLKTAFLAGKLLPYFIVNLVQIALMFSVGVILFDMKLGNFTALIIISLALAMAANGLGLFVAALGKTEAQVNGLSVFLAITLSAVGGMMVPAFIMPGVMKTFSLFTPHAWALAGYHDVIVRGLGVSQVLPEVGVLMGFAGLFFLLALWKFRFD